MGELADSGMTMICVSHEMGFARNVADRVIFMDEGEIVEVGTSEELFTNPLHPYTKALISAALSTRPDIERDEIVLTGEVPSPANPPAGCRFHTRCPWAFDRCITEEPQVKEMAPGHTVSCHLFD
jgi:oligopeptide/dipeptide ABC transporter ATP-binding protein